MSEQKITFNLDDVNITDIMSQIHENIKSRGYDIEELKKLGSGIRIPKDVGYSPKGLDECVASVNMSAQVQYWWQIPSQGGLKGKFRVFVNKVMRKLNFFYIKHVFDQQNLFNTYTASTVTNLSEVCKKLEADNQELLLKISALYNQNAALQTQVEKLVSSATDEAQKYSKKVEEIEKMYIARQIQLDSVCTTLSARIARLSDNKVKKDLSVEAASELSVALLPVDTDENHKFDYFLFESKFRGSREDIKKRQLHYLQYFVGQENVLDLGCGRGEFLELLSENGIKAEGVDLLEENIETCKEHNLNVRLGDGIAYLKSLPDYSLGGIFSAQVIEHISNDELVELLRLAHKKLKSGAKIVLETLNPQCLMIYAESLYLDPSHTKPVHPYVVKFIAECEGFTENHLVYMTPSDEAMKLKLDNSDNESIKTINNLIFGNREYALIAEK